MNFKNLITIIVAMAGLCACGPSNEEKAQKMAENYLKETLYHFESYKPLEIKVDSSFVSLASDKESLELILGLFEFVKSADEYAGQIERAESDMDIWSPNGYSTATSRGEYKRAKEKRDNSQRLLDKTKNHIHTQFEKIKERQSSLKLGEFNGWKVYHRFKSLNGAGTLELSGEYIFFCDENFNVTLAYSKEDFDAMLKIMRVVEESDELPELFDKMEDLYLSRQIQASY